ncbi:helix-turn-helix domain-containing protein [Paractinoplanes brasiliensis]|uniref:TetR family transcriptional regulator n=1 Tax=Paractinoplanes brasiliensis TaxID=52695 RepID=A0A4R6JSP4_9ACTN|nr:TetR/AcrR family transcriptional regulator [Actinoplanes brasiliensis]TDO38441.1 TetR family transcriptional regulator [Actinoplanes brasiliensis]GID26784.1 TetR family transcriptional regulator [Actinoplanes brasiliensis]
MAASTRPMRADARRNYEQILAAAEAEVARAGAEASLEEIARQAGVGSATLHRHFPSRQALLEAVFHDRVVTLCNQAHELAAQPGTAAQHDGTGGDTQRGVARRDTPPTGDAGQALTAWLRSLASFGAVNRGLAKSLLGGARSSTAGSCETMLIEAGNELLGPAQAAGAVRPEVTIIDLLTLVNAVSLATEGSPDAAAEAARLATLALDGVRPRR